MVCYFAGGAIGSALGGSLYDSHGWAGAMILGAALGITATLTAVVDVLHPLSERHRRIKPAGNVQMAGQPQSPESAGVRR
jgi:MFS family permease